MHTRWYQGAYVYFATVFGSHCFRNTLLSARLLPPTTADGFSTALVSLSCGLCGYGFRDVFFLRSSLPAVLVTPLLVSPLLARYAPHTGPYIHYTRWACSEGRAYGYVWAIQVLEEELRKECWQSYKSSASDSGGGESDREAAVQRCIHSEKRALPVRSVH